ncbi:expressed unknown protein [Seminavis robusta]|uniref:Uncharacterized protein n=1 Tax=Seminavis robusta TaxID=568900 RepID=A0A9N8E3C8_9STRA|nr:expressed unknown protein [Seminavis robusta]|eukprot:Sro617_g176120.1 n/a (273) ;mRNA; f:36114-37013
MNVAAMLTITSGMHTSKHALGILQRGGGLRSVMIGSLHCTRSLATSSRTKARPTKNRTLKNLHAASRAPPSMAVAKAMPLSCKEMENSELVLLGHMGNVDARKEILTRHIMTVDKVTYETAKETALQIAAVNRQGMGWLTIPYKIGIGVALTAALGSFPMVFDINTVTWFNEFYVTADVPEPKDLETPLEVGSWAWNWMEPPLGQISFVLLCLQYTRSQIDNLGARPYTQMVMTSRAEKLAKAFPQYDADIVKDFSLAISFYHDKHGLRSRN